MSVWEREEVQDVLRGDGALSGPGLSNDGLSEELTGQERVCPYDSKLLSPASIESNI